MLVDIVWLLERWIVVDAKEASRVSGDRARDGERGSELPDWAGWSWRLAGCSIIIIVRSSFCFDTIALPASPWSTDSKPSPPHAEARKPSPRENTRSTWLFPSASSRRRSVSWPSRMSIHTRPSCSCPDNQSQCPRHRSHPPRRQLALL
jgi:hypothetical protein